MYEETKPLRQKHFVYRVVAYVEVSATDDVEAQDKVEKLIRPLEAFEIECMEEGETY